MENNPRAPETMPIQHQQESQTPHQAVPPYNEKYPPQAPQQYYGGDQPQGQQAQPLPPQSQFQTAIPLAALNRSPAPVDCPICHQRAMTNVHYESGGFTHLLALALCVCICLGCIPYCISSCKNAKHTCGNCGTLLATWHRSGGTAEVHAH